MLKSGYFSYGDMDMNRYALLVLLFFLSVAQMFSQQIYYDRDSNIVIENKELCLVIGRDGVSKSLLHKPTGQECLIPDSHVPLCSITQYRPYDNENFLMFPAKPRMFPSNKIRLEGNELSVEFEDTYDIAVIAVSVKDDYIGFELKRRDYRIEDFGVKRKTEIDEFALIQLPVKNRKNFGEWLNVMWDDEVAVNLLATHPATRIDAFRENGYTTLYAGLDYDVKFMGAGAALIVSSKEELLSHIGSVETDFDMPRGVQSRLCPEYKYSYYELRDVTRDNIDEHIRYAKMGGFKTIVIYYVDFAKSCGHYPWRKEYPNGMDDLKFITDKIRQAEMIPGIHIHYSKVGRNDPYLTSATPDTRFNHVRNYTLSKPLSATDTVIEIEENPEGARLENGRQLLQIGTELVTYSGYTTEPPYRFFGCKRGDGNSIPASYPKGMRFGLLDVDDWPLFIRIDQNTSIQKEIAERLGKIYHDAGFRFVYFDGAEDVPMPYWYNVSRSQLTVYNELKPAPLFAEGALKSHYGWHILSRGNAFDHFPPERIRQSMKKYTARCAEQIAKDFTSVNFGWVDYLAPSEKTIGMQPDMYEYICSKAVAWNSPISLVGKLPEIRKHPRTADNFHVIKMWEDAKNSGAITEEQKALLKNLNQEFILLKDKSGKYEMYPYKQITSDAEAPVRAFLFNREGKICIVYWHMDGEGELSVEIPKKLLSLSDGDGQKVSIKSRGNYSVLPVGKRLFLEMDLAEEDAIRLFRQAAGYE